MAEIAKLTAEPGQKELDGLIKLVGVLEKGQNGTQSRTNV
jgi:hypothetical protein